jgi:hypothetical protein
MIVNVNIPGSAASGIFYGIMSIRSIIMRKMTSFRGIVRPVVPVLGAVLLEAAVSGCGGKQQGTAS